MPSVTKTGYNRYGKIQRYQRCNRCNFCNQKHTLMDGEWGKNPQISTHVNYTVTQLHSLIYLYKILIYIYKTVTFCVTRAVTVMKFGYRLWLQPQQRGNRMTTIRRIAARSGYKPPRLLSYFDHAIREGRAS